MTDQFISLLDRSISAGWLVLFLLLLRPLIRKAPKWIGAALWAAVGLRLILPAWPVSPLSLLPSGQTIAPEIQLSPKPSFSATRLTNVRLPFFQSSQRTKRLTQQARARYQ